MRQTHKGWSEARLAAALGDLDAAGQRALAAHEAGCDECARERRWIAALNRALEPPAAARAVVAAPGGFVELTCSERGVVRVDLHLGSPAPRGLSRSRPASGPAAELLARASREVSEYLAGERTGFTVPVDLAGQPEFRRHVLEATRQVPRGSVVSYGELARRIGRPGAQRAVGTALRQNPVPLIVPCHRVVRSDGQPGEYSGGGPAVKRWLLQLEGAAV